MFHQKEIPLIFVFLLGTALGISGCGERNSVMSEPAPGVTVVSREKVPQSVPPAQDVFTPLPKEPLERNKTIQTALHHAGYYAGAIDGKVGPLTRQAILDFQKSEGLQVDGKVGPVTWKALEKHLPEEAAQ